MEIIKKREEYMKKILQKIKNIDIKYLHIALIVLGSIFILLSAFHTNLWFDESYSVGLANHSFGEIWAIDKNDVHPVLYYWILHALNLIFGNNIIIYRLFSVLCTVLLGVIGYTHVKKDFGEKVGILFSFFAFFLPPNLIYSGEIRMYSMAMLIVFLAFIYAYRIYKDNSKNTNEINIKNWILFGVFSLASAYTHYYALMAAGIINLVLMIILIKNSIKNKKISKNLKAFFICAVIQVGMYMPWLITFIKQLAGTSGGFWIGVHFPATFIDLLTFCFTGNLTDSGTIYINVVISIIWSYDIIRYLIFLATKSKNEEEKRKLNPAFWAISLFGTVMLGAVIVSLVMWQSIVYARYMLCILGMLMLFMSIVMTVKGDKKINALMCIICVIMSLYVNINLINTNYDEENFKPINYITEDIKQDDIFLVDDKLSGISISVRYEDNISYFYNRGHWGVDEAYKAFAKDFRTVLNYDFLNDFSGRIWIISTDDNRILDEVEEEYNVIVIKQEMFKTKYKNQQYSISLVEK